MPCYKPLSTHACRLACCCVPRLQVDTEVRQHCQALCLPLRGTLLQGLPNTRENHAAGAACWGLAWAQGRRCLPPLAFTLWRSEVASIDCPAGSGLLPVQVYVALCRLSQNSEAAPKDAVRKGIDIMIPNLARAAAADAPVIGPVLVDTGDSIMSKDSTASGAAASGAAGGVVGGGASGPSAAPSYARFLKRVLSEDGHVSVTLVHLLQVIVRNRDMFFQSRCVGDGVDCTLPPLSLSVCCHESCCSHAAVPSRCTLFPSLASTEQRALHDDNGQCHHTPGPPRQLHP